MCLDMAAPVAFQAKVDEGRGGMQRNCYCRAIPHSTVCLDQTIATNDCIKVDNFPLGESSDRQGSVVSPFCPFCSPAH